MKMTQFPMESDMASAWNSFQSMWDNMRNAVVSGSTLESEVGTLRNEVAALKAQIDDVSYKHRGLLDALDNARQQRERSELENISLRKQVQDQATELTQARNSAENHRRDYEEAFNSWKDETEVSRKLALRVAELEDENKRFRDAYETLSGKLRGLTTDLGISNPSVSPGTSQVEEPEPKVEPEPKAEPIPFGPDLTGGGTDSGSSGSDVAMPHDPEHPGETNAERQQRQPRDPETQQFRSWSYGR